MDKTQQALYDLYSGVREDFQFSCGDNIYTKQQLLDGIRNKVEPYECLKKLEHKFVSELADKKEI